MKCDDCDRLAEYAVGRTAKVCETCLIHTVAELLPVENPSLFVQVRRVEKKATKRKKS